MTLHEYKDDFCKRCGKCKKNLEYYQSHCIEQDLIDETWWKCEESMVDKACEWLDNEAHVDGCEYSFVIENFCDAMMEGE